MENIVHVQSANYKRASILHKRKHQSYIHQQTIILFSEKFYDLLIIVYKPYYLRHGWLLLSLFLNDYC